MVVRLQDSLMRGGILLLLRGKSGFLVGVIEVIERMLINLIVVSSISYVEDHVMLLIVGFSSTVPSKTLGNEPWRS